MKPSITTTVLGVLFCCTALAADVPFGTFPNCVAPAIPLEVHSWWWKMGENAARHLHLAACGPNARDTTGELVSLSEPATIPVKVTAFNQPGVVSWARWSWESDVRQRIPIDATCQTAPDEMRECEWWVNFVIDPAASTRGGLRELRMSPNVEEGPAGLRQFGTLNFQVWLRNGRMPSNYRSRPDPIGRSWYPGFEYANVSVNYVDHFRGAADLGLTVPRVSGIVPLRVRHREGERVVRSQLWQDPDFHARLEDWSTGNGRLYSHPGNFDGTYHWDTRALAPGRHALYFETMEADATGLNVGALKLLFDVGELNDRR